MKRIKFIRYVSFRKNWSVRYLILVVFAVVIVFMLVGCEKSDEIVFFY